MRRFELVMTLINAQERGFGEWAEIFQNAEKGYEFSGATRPPG